MKVLGQTVYERNPAFVIRDAEWVLLYRDGKTLQEIGDMYGVTRERVRQRLARLGLSSSCGGRSMRSLRNVPDKIEKAKAKDTAREAKSHAKYGMGYAEIKKISPLPRGRAAHPLRRFGVQRRSARKRGIEWQMTFAEWWGVWQDSGNWAQRGRNAGQFVMARWADDGPYSVDNVYICTVEDNGRHMQIIKNSGSPKSGFTVAVGVYNVYPGVAKSFLAKANGRSLGTFKTVEEAIAARATFASPQPAVTPFGGPSPG